MAGRFPPFPGDGTARPPPRLWRSLEELENSPDLRAYLEAEFPEIARGGGIDRRSWLRLVGASLALAGLPACSAEPVLGDPPLLSPPEHRAGYVPGRPVWIATSLELGGLGRGVLVKSQEGRPHKIEGNPLHPASLGATDVFAQAELLSLYDPDRSRGPAEGGMERDWDDAERLLAKLRVELSAERGKGWRFLLPQIASPTLDRLVDAMRQSFPEARWHRHSPSVGTSAHAGAGMAFGRPLDLVPDLTRADAIVTLGGDIFSTEPGHIRLAADYQARRRAVDRPLPRLFAAESTPSLAGARADERIVLRPRDLEQFARDLWAGLGSGAAPSDDAHPAAARLQQELRRAGSRALVLVGREQPASVHALANAINARLGAFGTTVHAMEPVLPVLRPEDSITGLAEAIAGGEVSRLVILGGNPAHDAPADLDFAGLIRKLPLSFHLGFHRDETAAACTWHLPGCHALEAFGDLRAFDGAVGLRQPACVRLAPSLSPEEVIAALLGMTWDGRELLTATWRQAWAENFEARFARSLEDGIVEGSASPRVVVALEEGWEKAVAPASPKAGLDIVFSLDPSVWDGSFANNAWLQELPKPLTKQVWGNAALIAPETASALALLTGDLVEVLVEGRSVAAPAWVLPGQAPGTVTLPLGYGRGLAGSVGSNIGFDAFRLRTAANPWLASGALKPLGGKAELISTQHHHALPDGDVLRVVAAGGQHVGGPSDAQPSLYPAWRYEGHAWGMSIDLDACIGCNACVIACQAENNVMVVGPEEVAKGREMHWLRIDRYHRGASDEPETFFQPVPCMHCEQAPCEVVCPVNATVHSSEGLNDMVYNRCVGTRTCSNNCPYKVRRFNFFDTSAAEFATADDALNPHVTVRERGVMEKCTYCVQRIWAARTQANVEDRPIRDCEIVTACSQACPTQAIVFGDVNDADSAVSRLKRNPRDYAMLGELNTRPRTTYLARVAAQGRGGS